MIKVRLSTEELRGALLHARQNHEQGIGTYKSQVHDVETRQQRMTVDQAVGQVATCAVAKYLYGTTQLYFLTRFWHSQHPDTADHGYDIGCANVDVKGSFMRGSKDPSRYNLLLRPSDLREDWVYIQCLIDHASEDPTHWITEHPTIYIPGYATPADLPREVEDQHSSFKGCYRLSTIDLNPLPPLRYHWFNNT